MTFDWNFWEIKLQKAVDVTNKTGDVTFVDNANAVYYQALWDSKMLTRLI